MRASRRTWFTIALIALVAALALLAPDMPRFAMIPLLLAATVACVRGVFVGRLDPPQTLT